jgi:antitoxin (DNA-binding transcriptional repressor) of toxin-antitoxin stability system
MRMTATELRSQLYRVLDRIAETGEPVEIVRKGKTLRISAEVERPRVFSSERLAPHPGTIVGDPDDLIQVDWSKEWRPFEGEG